MVGGGPARVRPLQRARVGVHPYFASVALEVPGFRHVHLRFSRLRPGLGEDQRDGDLAFVDGLAGPGPWHASERHDLSKVPLFGGPYLGDCPGFYHAGLGADEVLV